MDYTPKYFKWHEFDSKLANGQPDAGTGQKYMNRDFVRKLDVLREKCGFPFFINSGYRTPAHNKRVRGSLNSKHMLGRAVDIRVKDGKQARDIAFHAFAMGLRVGINRESGRSGFVHVDDVGYSQVWTY